jgi:hypothetical protein
MKNYISVILLALITGYLIVKIAQKDDQLQDSFLQQAVIESEINHQSLNVNKLIEHLSTNTEIILLEESGTSEISYSRNSNSFLKWCTQSDITLQSNYNVIISIPTNSIKIIKQNDEIFVSFNERDFQIKSIDLYNKTVTRKKDLLGKSYNDNELIVLESLLKDKIKSTIMTQETYSVAAESLKVYMVNLAEDLEIKINFQ